MDEKEDVNAAPVQPIVRLLPSCPFCGAEQTTRATESKIELYTCLTSRNHWKKNDKWERHDRCRLREAIDVLQELYDWSPPTEMHRKEFNAAINRTESLLSECRKVG